MADRMISLRMLIWASLIASAINVMPLFMFPIGGDIFFHYVMIDCFSHQFWQGDLYPRWCMNANAGLGLPLSLFYFPLPYYITAMLYPLTRVGINIYGIYELGATLVTLVSFLTCYAWLKDIVAPKSALLASILFLFIPYRMEVMLFRSAYAELWGLAFLPLVFKYTRRIIRGECAVASLAMAFALMFLSHIPVAVTGVIASGLYVLIMSGKAWRPKLRYASGLLWSIGITLFYVLPAAYYRQFITPQDIIKSPYIWANYYLNMNNLVSQNRPIILMALTVLAIMLLLITCLRRRPENAFLRRETKAWAALLVTAIFLLLPVSAPFYELLGPASRVVFPWRMQSIFVLCLAFLLALWLQGAGSCRKTWRTDYAMLAALMAMLSYFPLMMRDASYEPTGRKIIAADAINMIEYRSRWTDADHYSLEYTLARYDRKAGIPLVQVIAGKGRVAPQHWAWDGIKIDSDAKKPMTLRLDHHYFPLWSAVDEHQQPLRLYPELGTGQMLLDIPAGKHDIVLHRDIMAPMPALFRWGCWLSAIASVVMLIQRRRERNAVDD